MGKVSVEGVLIGRIVDILSPETALRGWKMLCFVSGHDFSRAENNPKNPGFSPCLSLPCPDLFRKPFSSCLSCPPCSKPFQSKPARDSWHFHAEKVFLYPHFI